MKYLERRFKLREAGTSIRTEIVPGMTTFMTMAYILVINPTILACAGKSGIIREDGSIPHCKEALLAGAIGTTGGAMQEVLGNN